MRYSALLPLMRACRYPHTVAEWHAVIGGNIRALDNRLRAWAESEVIMRELVRVPSGHRAWGYWAK